MDGYTLARKLRTKPELVHAKLIALTTHVGEPFVRLAWDAGFDDYFPKPADLPELNRLKELLSATALRAAQNQEVARE
jgi:CheY-like chemotaxis protein